jgi:SAM-dependent methyltransferase
VNFLSRKNSIEYPAFHDPPDEIHFREHLLRYEFSLPYVEGKRVLDIGCGARRGPFLLAQKARLVIGTDASQQAVQEAAKIWKNHHLFYTVVDAHLPCFHPNVFDAITCFEVIEHLPEPSATLSAIAMLLKPDGLFILSTPNRIRTQNKGKTNPHHVQEFSKDELESLLSSYFSTLEFFSLIRTPRAEALLDAREKSYQLTRLDPLGFRNFIPTGLRKRLYDSLTLLFAGSEAKGVAHLDSFDVQIVPGAKLDAWYFVGLCQKRTHKRS